jgi:hypothetical protein
MVFFFYLNNDFECLIKLKRVDTKYGIDFYYEISTDLDVTHYSHIDIV